METFNGIDFNEYAANIVYKNESILVGGTFKRYENGFEVDQYIDTEYLNNINIYDILTKSGKQEITCPIIFQGNVLINSNTEIYGDLNDVRMEFLMKSFEVIDGGYKINGGYTF